MSEWLSMVTAPRNGKLLLVWTQVEGGQGAMSLGFWDAFTSQWVDDCENELEPEGFPVKVTHWMPLPEPPK